MGGATQKQTWGHQPIVLLNQIIPENYTKMKEIGPGGGAPWYPPKTGHCLGSVDVERVIGLNINIYIQCPQNIILSFIFRTTE